MIAIIFEVWPADGRKGDYLALAARLKASSSAWTGSSRWSGFRAHRSRQTLSLSFWRDEGCCGLAPVRSSCPVSGTRRLFRGILRVAAVVRDGWAWATAHQELGGPTTI
jgi:hypothetical protein